MANTVNWNYYRISPVYYNLGLIFVVLDSISISDNNILAKVSAAA